MKSSMHLSLVIAGLLVTSVVAQSKVSRSDDWEQFKAKYGKHYAQEEDAWRMEIFLADLQEVERFNREDSEKMGYSIEVNSFSDLTPDEIQRFMGYRVNEDRFHEAAGMSERAEQFLNQLLEDDSPVPDSIDWRDFEGRVSSVKNQEINGLYCGSCWAMSVAGLLEGQQLKVTNRTSLVDLSVQNIMDCSDRGNCGRGGNPIYGIQVLSHIGGIMSEKDYPYKALDDSECKFDLSKSILRPSEAILLPPGDESTLKKVVARYGPVAVSMRVESNFQKIRENVYLGEPGCNGRLNHAVLIVGYGNDPDGGDYWLIKNSWGTGVHVKGYVRIRRGANICRIADEPIIAMF